MSAAARGGGSIVDVVVLHDGGDAILRRFLASLAAQDAVAAGAPVRVVVADRAGGAGQALDACGMDAAVVDAAGASIGAAARKAMGAEGAPWTMLARSRDLMPWAGALGAMLSAAIGDGGEAVAAVMPPILLHDGAHVRNTQPGGAFPFGRLYARWLLDAAPMADVPDEGAFHAQLSAGVSALLSGGCGGEPIGVLLDEGGLYYQRNESDYEERPHEEGYLKRAWRTASDLELLRWAGEKGIDLGRGWKVDALVRSWYALVAYLQMVSDTGGRADGELWPRLRDAAAALREEALALPEPVGYFEAMDAAARIRSEGGLPWSEACEWKEELRLDRYLRDGCKYLSWGCADVDAMNDGPIGEFVRVVMETSESAG